MKIACIIGTRPEAIKLAPLVLQLSREVNMDVQVVNTGQHRDMTSQVYELFGIVPHIHLDVMTEEQSLTSLTAALHLKLGHYMRQEKPAMVIVQGDTTSAMVGALEAFYHGIPLAHVEAGLRTRDLQAPFPEELNRMVIAQVAALHFAPTSRAFENLFGEKKQVVFETGNTVVDALNLLRRKIDGQSAEYFGSLPMMNTSERVILITAHRRESFGKGLEGISEAVSELARKHPDYRFVFPVHLNPQVQQTVRRMLGDIPNVYLIDPVKYDELLFIMSRSFIILTDSGGIQEEAPAFDVPLLVLRDTTERPEGVEAGCALLVGTDKKEIVFQFENLVNDHGAYRRMAQGHNPYGDGKACERIVKHILQYFRAS